MNISALDCPSCGAPQQLQPKPYKQFTHPSRQSALMLTDFTGNGWVVCKRCGKVNSPTNRL